MRVCPRCRTTVGDEVVACPNDGYRPVSREVLDASGNDPLLGATLAERYTITGRLGAGGMGTVYRAEQAPLSREVALKVLRKELGRDPETVARFTREAKLLSQLRHPNTVAILDFGQSTEGLLYLAMELLEGEMLSARLRTAGSLTVSEAVRVASGVLRSLDEAHARGIVHRDLKPDNIFLARVHGRPEEAEVVKVVDFGIAKIRDGDASQGLDPVATQEGTVFGTPRYMSPEQAQGRSLDGRSDLYAVGVLLFHMLTGAPPFTDDDAVIVMAHHIKTEPPRVRGLAPSRGIPESLDQLVARALAKDPDERPMTAQDFLTELEVVEQDLRAARERAMLFTEETAVIAIPATQRPAWVGFALGAAALAVAAVGFSQLMPRASRNDGAAATTARVAMADTAARDRRSAVSSPAPTPAPVAPAPVAAAPVVPVAPVAPVPSATVAVAAANGGDADAELDRRHHGRRHGPARQVPISIVTTPPPVTPTRPASRNNSQPYRTFEGM